MAISILYPPWRFRQTWRQIFRLKNCKDGSDFEDFGPIELHRRRLNLKRTSRCRKNFCDDVKLENGETFYTLRQQIVKDNQKPNFALSDYVSPKGGDHVGAFAVTVLGEEKYSKPFEEANDDYSAIMVKSLADRFAEAAAEALHEQVRKTHWGYAEDESLTPEQLIKEGKMSEDDAYDYRRQKLRAYQYRREQAGERTKVKSNYTDQYKRFVAAQMKQDKIKGKFFDAKDLVGNDEEYNRIKNLDLKYSGLFHKDENPQNEEDK